FGAAWSHDGRAYFAANSGDGVYEVLIDTVDLEAGTAVVRHVASSEGTAWNDGMNCVGIPTCIPDTFGSVYGYVWVDWEASGDRTAIEDGIEEHVAGVTVTVTLESTYLNSKGHPCDFGPDSWSVQTLGNDSGDYRWQVDGLPAVDGAGNELLYKATFDYRGADFPDGFTPTGYTVRVSDGTVVNSELDSDVLPMIAATPSQTADPMVRSLLLSRQSRRLLSTHQATGEDPAESTLAASSTFSVVDGETVHRADAGVVGTPVFDPESAITVDCVAESAVVELDNTASTVEANFKVRAYYGDSVEGDEPDHTGSQLVPPGVSQTYEKTIPPPFGDLLTILVSADAWRNGVPIGQVEFGANDLGVYCDPPFGVMVTAVPDCDAGTVVVTLQNFSPEEMNAPTGTQGVAAHFTAALYRDGNFGEQLGDTPSVSGGWYDEIPAGGVLTKNVTVEEDGIWFVVWTAEDTTDPTRSFEGILPSTDGELFDCVEPVVDPDVTFVVDCAAGADDSATVTIQVDNTQSERAVDVRIKRFGNSSPQQGQVLAGGIKDFYEQDAVHRDKFTIEVTTSDTEPDSPLATAPEAFRDGPGQIRFTTFEVTPQRQPLDLVEVVVQPGDTLSEIAAEHGISTSELMASNGIAAPGMIRIGQRLTVNVPPASPVVIVEVQPGDTLSEIAAEHGASADLLMLWNGIENPRLIRIGQQLTVGVSPNFDIWTEADRALMATLTAAAKSSRNRRVTIAEEGDVGQAGVPAFTALVDIEVDCPNFEPLITIRVYCASEMVHIHVFTAGSDIDGYIRIYENDTVVYEGLPGPGGLYEYDEEFVYGATYLVEVTADGVTDPDSFEPVTLSEDVDCETPFDPTLEVTADCSNQGPIVKAKMDNAGSDVAVEFTLTLIINGLDPIQIGLFNVGAGLQMSVDVQAQAGIPSVALEDATWRIEWEASGVDVATLTETGNTGSLPTDCVDPVGPFECTAYRAPIQVLLTASGMGYDVSALDVASGSYQVAYTIPFTSTDPLYEELNGVGLNPVDGAAYGVMSVYEDGAGSSYLIRFDAERIEYLALMPAMSNSATVDSEGSFLWMVDGSLYRADDIAGLVGYVGHNDPRIVDYRNIQPVFNASRAGDLYGHAVDLAHLRVDLGAGETDYVFGVVYGGDQIVVIGYRGADLGRRLLQPVDGTSEELPQLQSLEPVEIMVRSGDTLSEIAADHGLTTSELMVMNGIADASKIRIGQVLTVSMTSTSSEQSTSLPGGGYGAAWNIGDRLLVAANAGGVYELVANDVDLAAGTIQVRKVGKSGQSGSNDGMNCPGIPDCFPEVFGDAFGYVWVDWESSGDRTAVEYGIEEHVSGVSVTLMNTTAFYDSDGEACYQAGELVIPSTYTGEGLSSGSDTGDFRWLVEDIPAEDNSGKKVVYQATFDYVDADFPFGFEPAGYTVNKPGAVVESEVDSDVTPQHGAQRSATSATSSSSSAVSGDFTVEPGAVVHRADAGVIGDPVFGPTVEVDIDCASDSALIEFDNSASTVHARFDVLVYHGAAQPENLVDSQSDSEIVGPGDVAVYGLQVPPPRGETLTLVVTAAPQRDDLDLGFEPVVVWNQAGVDCPNGFVVLVEIQADCDVGGVRITLDNSDSEVAASFTVSLIVDEETSDVEIHQVDAGVIKERILPLPEDSSWSIEWTAGDAEDPDQSFDGFTDPQDFDCEPLPFEPVLTVSHVCSPLGDSATFSVDNSDSGVDAVVELYDGSELIWGPETVEAGTVMEETTIPATGVESVTIVIIAGVEAASYSPTRVKEILECPEVNVTAFDCAAYPALIQVIGEKGVGFHIKQLDIASGEYTAIYSLPFDRTPAFEGMNAVGINP
ncbi:MAG TPA: LysM peptidoglycan-binding domain-containing protein, partial [Acidimicrobiia bacterium]|nr:LysM peptidoglycan-binding domain-containing protein [Acidimicrobiia bacterium]